MSLAGISIVTLPLSDLLHLRSFSTNSAKAAPNSPRPVSKSIPSSPLPTMSSDGSVIASPRIPHSYEDEDGNLSTLLDPRSRTMSPANDNGSVSPSQHPDLSNEVATLSNKLINAINHQTNLDDILSETRHELEASRERVKQLEQENQEHVDMLASGILVKKAIAEVEKNRLILSLANERRRRGEIEKEKKDIEQELETLTTALFEEANKVSLPNYVKREKWPVTENGRWS